MQRLFSLGTRGSAGAAAVAAAAAASPSTAECHAQTARRPFLQRTKGQSSQQAADETLQTEQSWILPDLQEGQVYFQPEEVEESVVQLFDAVYRPAKRPASIEPASSEADTDSESVESLGSEANLFIEQADHSAAPRQMENVLIKMLQQPGVQHACLTALMADEGFRDMVNGKPLLEDASPARNAADVLIEEIDDHEAKEEKHPLSGLVDALGSQFAKLGEGLKKASSTIGSFLVDMGYRLHSIMGKPATAGKPSPEGIPKKLQEEWWAKAIMTVACSIFVIMVMKRVPPV
ncbi:hypothetical protein WJX74_003545 [Apatococcus lobatus]|uniref:Uncharacterized protein n=2 Tax=Apatococcus TaxID=904362 RepID=A0AAW1SJG8_9CHLO